MNRIEPSQGATLGQLAGAPRDLRGQLDDHEAPEIAIEGGDGAGERASRDASLPMTPYQRGAGFRVRDTGGCDHGAAIETRPRLIGPGFPHIGFHQRARVEIEDQRRSSTTAADTDGPRTRGASSSPVGLPPDHARRPLSTRVFTNSSSPVVRAGTMTATGRLRSVTVTVSPRRTRARVALNLFLSSRTPIRAFVMTPPDPSGYIISSSGYLSSARPGEERRQHDLGRIGEPPTVPREEGAVLALLAMEVRGQLERDGHASGEVEQCQEPRPLVAVVGLALEERVLLRPPLGHGGVAGTAGAALIRPRGQVDGGPDLLPRHGPERHGRVGGAQVLPDRQVHVVLAHAEAVLARPELERPGIDVEERRAREARAQRRGHGVGEIQQERVARPGAELCGRQAVVLRVPGRIVARALGEADDRRPFGHAEPPQGSPERTDE